jgi:putative adhesin
MKTLFRYTVAALLLAGAVPTVADAQVYPERIKAKVKEIVNAYQKRDRDDSREQQVERSTKTIRLGANGSLDVGNIAGDITVTRGGGSDATIEIIKTARGRTVDDAREQLQLVQVEVTERNGRGEVKTRYPGGDEQRRSNHRNINVSVAYNIAVPAGTHLGIKSISGDIKVTDVKGEITAETISGNVRIAGPSRVAAAKSISGSVEIANAQTDGGLDAGSISGDVTLRKVTARRIDMSSISGNLKLEDVQCDRVGAHSTSGSVGFVGALAHNGRYELKSFSGEVRITLSGGAGFEVEASSFSGEVRSDFPIQISGTSNDRRRRRSLTGSYGDASAVLQITTFSGSIVITKR